MLPIGGLAAAARPPRLRAACDPLLAQVRRAGARCAYVVVAPGKWDVPAFLGDGAGAAPPLAYLVARESPTTVHTVDHAYAFVRDTDVLLGFPDIGTEPEDAFVHLLDRRSRTGADVVLGLFPAVEPALVDMVDSDPDGALRRIVVKPTETELGHTWLLASWGSRFTQFVHDWISSGEADAAAAALDRELYLGDAFVAAAAAGLRVDTLVVPGGSYTDFAAPERVPG